MTLYDEYGNEITLEISDNESVLEALSIQNENLETVIEGQADVILALSEQNAQLAEMNQYSAYIFVLILFYFLYRLFGGALSSMFGGG